MKILFITTNDEVPWGGSEELWSASAVLLVGRGHRVTASVWGRDPEPVPIANLRAKGVRLHKRHRQPILRNRFSQAWSTLLEGAPQAFRSNELEGVELEDPEFVVFSVGYQLCPKFVRISRELRRRNVQYGVVVQLVREGLPISDDLCEEVRAAYNGAKRAWFVSEQNVAIMRRELADQFTNAELADNPVELEVDTPAYPDPRSTLSIAMVGSLTPYHKGQDLVIEVLSRPRWRERPLRVDLYGEGSAHTTLQRRIDQLGLDKVAFKGFEPDKAVIWGGHQAALFASRMEGRSLALQEAMAHARMVISTDVGGARDLIDHGTNGFLVPYASVEALDKVLEEAWQDRARWEAMGQAARQRILGAIGKDPALRFAEAIESAFSGTAQPFGLGYSKNRRT